MRVVARRIALSLSRSLILILFMVTACQTTTIDDPVVAGPEVIIPPGVVSFQTADQVAQRMFDEIAANERKLGRVLEPARIIRVRLLRAGEMYPTDHFDGTNPDQSAMGPTGGPGWVVEAVGTFVGFDRQSGALTAIGTHGFHEWDDAGGEATGFNPCWTLRPSPAADLDGVCR